MGYSLTNTTKKKGSSSSSANTDKKVVVTRSEREGKKNGYSNGSNVSGSGSNSPAAKYDPNTDYYSAIQDAINRGTSDSEIDGLVASRDAKIKGEGLKYAPFTFDDVTNFKTQSAIKRGDYVIGQDGGNDKHSYNPTEAALNALRQSYGVTDPNTNIFADFNSGIDFDARAEAAKASGASQETIDGLLQMKEYSDGVRNGSVLPFGHGKGMGYGNRNTKFVFNMADGSKKTYSGNETMWRDAAKNSGLEGIIGLDTALTYGTASSDYAKPGYGFGTIMGPNDFTTEVRNNDEDGRLFNMNNMQLSFLSGRDGMDYYKPGEDFGYTGNGLVNAYNKGKEFEGLGPAMGGSSRAIGSYNDADLPSAALAQIREWQKQYKAAEAEYARTGSYDAYQAMQNAHAMAESIRAQFGYSGGIDGSAFLSGWNGSGTFPGGGFPGGTFPGGGTQGYGTNPFPEYKSPYQDEIDELLGSILDYDEFVYKLEDDPVFQQYASTYLREGNRALNDTLAAAASGAGGMNSYAVSSAQQAQNYYNTQLTDKVPELYGIAYDMYLKGFEQELNKLGVVQGLEDTAYGRYRDNVGDWFNNRDFNYNAYVNNRDFNYNKYRDEISDDRYNKEWEYSVSANDRDNAYNQAMSFLEMGIMPSADVLGKAGISMNEAQNFISAVLASRTKKSSGGSGRKSSGKSSKGKKLSTKQYSDLKAAYNSGDFDAYSDLVDELDATGYDLDEYIDRIASSSDIWYRANQSGGRTPVKKSEWAEGR